MTITQCKIALKNKGLRLKVSQNVVLIQSILNEKDEFYEVETGKLAKDNIVNIIEIMT